MASVWKPVKESFCPRKSRSNLEGSARLIGTWLRATKGRIQSECNKWLVPVGGGQRKEHDAKNSDNYDAEENGGGLNWATDGPKLIGDKTNQKRRRIEGEGNEDTDKHMEVEQDQEKMERRVT
ncbi:unnamed protein product [Cuscuta europaea]|uniref:Uncharacterized protein n=1 Tax=Cuscuta europaea TaxID=41803 RepID=A0A9P0YN23_CUSEU|nr:unnamed protein product [Cuscuta europaea]